MLGLCVLVRRSDLGRAVRLLASTRSRKPCGA